MTQQGDLYSKVVENTNMPRDAIKPTFQSFFSIKNENSYIYGGQEKDGHNRQILCKWFSKNYPNIYQALIDWHKNQDIKIKRVANQVESEIMNSICDELRALGLHPFRLHDAIYLPQNEKKDAEIQHSLNFSIFFISIFYFHICVSRVTISPQTALHL